MGDCLPKMPDTSSEDDPRLYSPSQGHNSWLAGNDDGFPMPLFQAQMSTSPSNGQHEEESSSGKRRELSFVDKQYTISSEGEDSDSSMLSNIVVAPLSKRLELQAQARNKKPQRKAARQAKRQAAATSSAVPVFTANQKTNKQPVMTSPLPKTPAAPSSSGFAEKSLPELLQQSLRRPSAELNAARLAQSPSTPMQPSSSTPAKKPARRIHRKAVPNAKAKEDTVKADIKVSTKTDAFKADTTQDDTQPDTTKQRNITSSGGPPTNEDEKIMHSLRSVPTPLTNLLRRFSDLQVCFTTFPTTTNICIDTTATTPIPTEAIAHIIGEQLSAWGVLVDKAARVAQMREGMDGELDREALVHDAVAGGHVVLMAKGKKRGSDEELVIRKENKGEGNGAKIAIDIFEKVVHDDKDREARGKGRDMELLLPMEMDDEGDDEAEDTEADDEDDEL